MNQFHIDSASKEAHAISGLRSGKVLVDPHKDHKSHKDPNEEKDDQSFPIIIPEEDSKDEEAPHEELIRVAQSRGLKTSSALSSFIEPAQGLHERKRGYIALWPLDRSLSLSH